MPTKVIDCWRSVSTSKWLSAGRRRSALVRSGRAVPLGRRPDPALTGNDKRLLCRSGRALAAQLWLKRRV
jgi:hypothetical protein